MIAVPTKPQRIRMSWEDYHKLPEGPPYYDYVNGEAVEVNRPSVRHQQIMFRLSNRLWEYAQANDLGLVAADVDVMLPGRNVFAPDIMFLSKEHLDRYEAVKGDIYGAPDLIIEIHSPSTVAYDRFEKIGYYQAAGVPWLWYIEQETLTIEEFEWTDKGYLLAGGAMPGNPFRPKRFPDFAIDLKALMEPSTPSAQEEKDSKN